jgi:hypothetical protein
MNVTKEDRIKELEAKQSDMKLVNAHKKLYELKLYIDESWNLERLLTCIRPELKTRFDRALDHYDDNIFITKNKIDLIEMMQRAYQALIDEAEALGFNKLDHEFWFIKYNDRDYVICKNDHDHEVAYNKYGNKESVTILTIQELLIGFGEDLYKIKQSLKKLNPKLIKYESISKK